MKRKIRLTESDLHRIVSESVNRVLKESQKASDAQNAVSQDMAEKLGFKLEYDTGDGYELWGRVVSKNDEKKILSILRIPRFTSYNMNGRALITVIPNEETENYPEYGGNGYPKPRFY